MDTFTPQVLSYFRTPPGRQLLQEAAHRNGNPWRLQKSLRRTFPAEMCRAALSLVDLRAHAAGKFSQSDRMFFDRAGLEMASGEDVAAYRAARIGAVGVVADLCCGIGGDLVALSAVNRVVGIDIDRTRVMIARLNSEVCSREPVGFAVADARLVNLRADLAFFDPARRGQRSRTVRGSEYEPSLRLVQKLRQQVSNLVVKVSPAAPEEDLAEADEVAFVSAGGQCREATLYYGPLARSRRNAVVLPGPHVLEAEAAHNDEVEVAPAGRFLFDPDPAVVRAHLITELSRLLDAWKLSPFGAYLCGSRPVFSPFARTYKVLESMPYGRKRVKQYLGAHSMRVLEIKKRGVTLDGDAELLHLKTPHGELAVSVVLERLERGIEAIICQRVVNSGD